MTSSTTDSFFECKNCENAYKLEDMRVLEVIFPNNEKIYEYYIHKNAISFLEEGEDYYIVNNVLYNYRASPVKIKKIKSFRDTTIANKIIIGIRRKDSSDDRTVAWLDDIIIQKKGYSLIEMYNALNCPSGEVIFTTRSCSKLNEATFSVAKSLKITEDSLTVNNNEDNKGDNNMNMNIFGNLEFGKVRREHFAMTLKGIAFHSTDSSSESARYTFVQYNVETGELEDVTPFVLKDLKVNDFLYKMPVAISQVKVGDIIFDTNRPVFVKAVKNSEITIVDPCNREVRTVLATKNAFNFNFVTKLVNLMDNFNLTGSATENNPFGNILPLMMLSDSENMNDMLPLMLLGNGGAADFTSNPMMLYFLMKDGKSNDVLPFLLMNNPNFFNCQNTMTRDSNVK